MKKRSHTDRAQSARRPAVASRARRAAPPHARRAAASRDGGSAAPRAKRIAPGAEPLALPAECTLAGADDLKQRLATLLRCTTSVRIDVSRVRRIDSASLQLLAAFARDRRAGALPIELTGESEAFAEGTRLLGLVRLLG